MVGIRCDDTTRGRTILPGTLPVDPVEFGRRRQMFLGPVVADFS